MKDRWLTSERIDFGNRDLFAVSLQFLPDPYPDEPLDPALRASWGELSIWVAGRNLCAHRVDGEHRDGCRWYLLPLLEWLIENWDPLLHEERLPGAVEESSDATTALGELRERARSDEAALEWFAAYQVWISRHGLSVAAEGGVFPELIARRNRAMVEFSWNSAGRFGEVEFDEPVGVGEAAPREVASTLHGVLSRAAEELTTRQANESRYVELARAADGLSDPERVDDRMAWLAGLGQSVDEITARWRQVREAARSVVLGASEGARAAVLGSSGKLAIEGHCRAPLLFGSLAPTIDATDARKIARMLVETYEAQVPRRELDGLVRSVPVCRRPAQGGYELAEAVQASLTLDTERPVEIDAIMERVGVRVGNIDLSDATARGLCIASPEHQPTAVVNRSYELNARAEVRRFTLAHELCHLLFDRDAGRELALASGPWAPRPVEQRANAFAAMFLMPRPLVNTAVAHAASAPTTLPGIREAAKTMETTPTATIDHLYNLGVIGVSDREQLREQLGFRLLD